MNVQLYTVVTAVVGSPLVFLYWIMKRATNKIAEAVLITNENASKILGHLDSALKTSAEPVIFRPLVKCSQCKKPVARYSTSADGIHTCINCKK